MPLRRHTRMKRGETPTRRSRMARRREALRKQGKKARANAKANRILNAECVKYEIYRCELGYEGCTGDYQLTHAHVAKRRELLPSELEHSAILACRNCHDRLDFKMTHAEMRREVERVLAARPARYDERRYSAA